MGWSTIIAKTSMNVIISYIMNCVYLLGLYNSFLRIGQCFYPFGSSSPYLSVNTVKMHTKMQQIQITSSLRLTFASMWNQLIPYLNTLLLSDFNDEICGVYFIIIHYTCSSKVPTPSLILKLGATELFISILSFEYFAVVRFWWHWMYPF